MKKLIILFMCFLSVNTLSFGQEEEIDTIQVILESEEFIAYNRILDNMLNRATKNFFSARKFDICSFPDSDVTFFEYDSLLEKFSVTEDFEDNRLLDSLDVYLSLVKKSHNSLIKLSIFEDLNNDRKEQLITESMLQSSINASSKAITLSGYGSCLLRCDSKLAGEQIQAENDYKVEMGICLFTHPLLIASCVIAATADFVSTLEEAVSRHTSCGNRCCDLYPDDCPDEGEEDSGGN